MATQKKIAELVLALYDNVDEAEQFSGYIVGLIKNCDKSYLLEMLDGLRDSVIMNRELGKSDILLSSDTQLDNLIKEANKVLGIKEE